MDPIPSKLKGLHCTYLHMLYREIMCLLTYYQPTHLCDIDFPIFIICIMDWSNIHFKGMLVEISKSFKLLNMAFWTANSPDPDKMMYPATIHQGLHYLLMSHLWEATQKWVDSIIK